MPVEIMFAVLLGLAWGFMILLPALIADSKGRSPWVWGLVGLFFPLITLLVLLILPSISPRRPGAP